MRLKDKPLVGGGTRRNLKDKPLLGGGGVQRRKIGLSDGRKGGDPRGGGGGTIIKRRPSIRLPVGKEGAPICEVTDVPVRVGGGAVLMVRRNERGLYECPNCQETYTRPDNLQRHLYAAHDIDRPGGRKWYKCPFDYCDEVQKRSDHLREHILFRHKINPSDVIPGSKPYLSIDGDPHKKFQCFLGVCVKEYRWRQDLYNHIRNSHGQDPREVMAEHFNKRPRPEGTITIPCVLSGCDSEFTTGQKLLKHLKNVHRLDPKPFREEVYAMVEEKGKALGIDPKLLKNGTFKEPEKGPPRVKVKVDEEEEYLEGKRKKLGVNPDSLRGGTYNEEKKYPPEVDVKMDEEEEGYVEEEEGFPFCMLCCCPFNLEFESMFEKLSESFHFNMFVCDMLAAEDLPRSLKKWRVCLECRNLVTCAMERKLGVEELRLRRTYESKEEMKRINLERRTDYCWELMRLEEVFKAADLENLRKEKYRVLAKKIREGVIAEMREVQCRIVELDEELKLF